MGNIKYLALFLGLGWACDRPSEEKSADVLPFDPAVVSCLREIDGLFSADRPGQICIYFTNGQCVRNAPLSLACEDGFCPLNVSCPSSAPLQSIKKGEALSARIYIFADDSPCPLTEPPAGAQCNASLDPNLRASDHTADEIPGCIGVIQTEFIVDAETGDLTPGKSSRLTYSGFLQLEAGAWSPSGPVCSESTGILPEAQSCDPRVPSCTGQDFIINKQGIGPGQIIYDVARTSQSCTRAGCENNLPLGTLVSLNFSTTGTLGAVISRLDAREGENCRQNLFSQTTTQANCLAEVGRTGDVSGIFGYPLEVKVTGQGRVTAEARGEDGNGISCTGNSSCYEVYVNGERVVLVAQAESGTGSPFAQWRGVAECEGSQLATCGFDMTGRRTPEAIFGRVLDVSFDGDGSVVVVPAAGECRSPLCSLAFPENTVVNLTPQAAETSVFFDWRADACGPMAPSCSVVMSGNQRVGLRFADEISTLVEPAQAQGLVDIVRTATASVNCLPNDTNCRAHPRRTEVEFSPRDNDIWRWIGWRGACAGTNNDRCTLRASGPTQVTGVFGHPLIVQVTGQGEIEFSPNPNVGEPRCTTSPCEGRYARGTNVTLRARGAQGWNFVGWQPPTAPQLPGILAPCTGSDPCAAAVVGPGAVRAVFRESRQLNVSFAGSAGGTVTLAGGLPGNRSCTSSCLVDYNDGDTVTLSAQAAAGAYFVGWESASGVLQQCTGRSNCNATVSGYGTVIARFEVIDQLTVNHTGGTVTVTPADLDNAANCTAANGVCVRRYARNTLVQLSAQANNGFTFGGWLEGGNPLATCPGPVCSVQVTAPRTLSVTFPVIRTLTINRVGAGAGTLTLNPADATGQTSCTTFPCTARYGEGSSITMTVVATGNAVFDGWAGGTGALAACTGIQPCSVTVAGNGTVNAQLTALQALSLGVAGSGGGTVTLSPAAVLVNGGTTVGNLTSCTANCTALYRTGSAVMLGANADGSSYFTGWSNASAALSSCNGTVANCQGTLNANANVTANFQAQRQLTVTVNGAGTVNLAPAPRAGAATCANATGASLVTCSPTYADATNVTVTQVAVNGWTFQGWTGACTGTGSCSLTAGANASVGAIFARVRRVNITVVGGGSVVFAGPNISEVCTSAAPCQEDVPDNTSITLVPQNGAQALFTGWTNATGSLVPCNNTTTNCTRTITADSNLTADFSGDYVLTVGFQGNGAGRVDFAPTPNQGAASCVGPTACAVGYLAGASVTLTPVASSGVFAGWANGSGSLAGCTGLTPCVRTINAAGAVNARYGFRLGVTISGTGTVNLNPGGINETNGNALTTCTANCGAIYDANQTVVLSAVPAANQVFTGWAGGCTGTGNCTLNMTTARTVTATFVARRDLILSFDGNAEANGRLTLSPADINGVTQCSADCTVSYPNGTSVNITATGVNGAGFAGWTAASGSLSTCTGVGACTRTINADGAITAQIGNTFTLSFTGGGAGTVNFSRAGILSTNGSSVTSCSANCTLIYIASNPAVGLTTVPTGANNTFVGWTGACTGTTCSLTMGTPRAVTADIRPVRTLNLTVTSTVGNPSVGVTPDLNAVNSCARNTSPCSLRYPDNTALTLTPGADFDNWNGSTAGTCAGVGAPCNFTITNNVTVNANF